MPKTLAEYPKCMTDAIGDLNDAIGRIKSWVADIQLYETMIEHFKDLPGLTSCHLSIDRFGAEITFVINDMRQMIPIRRWLREHGHPTPVVTDSPIGQRRLFTYYIGGHADLYLRAQLSYGDGAICKYVEIGTERKPIYELQCEGKTLEDKEEVLENVETKR